MAFRGQQTLRMNRGAPAEQPAKFEVHLSGLEEVDENLCNFATEIPVRQLAKPLFDHLIIPFLTQLYGARASQITCKSIEVNGNLLTSKEDSKRPLRDYVASGQTTHVVVEVEDCQHAVARSSVRRPLPRTLEDRDVEAKATTPIDPAAAVPSRSERVPGDEPRVLEADAAAVASPLRADHFADRLSIAMDGWKLIVSDSHPTGAHSSPLSPHSPLSRTTPPRKPSSPLEPDGRCPLGHIPRRTPPPAVEVSAPSRPSAAEREEALALRKLPVLPPLGRATKSNVFQPANSELTQI